MTMGNTCTRPTSQLAKVEYKETIPFIPPVTGGKVIKVYDGDTITIATTLPLRDNPDTVYRFSVRLLGIDTPEIRTKCDQERDIAKLAKQKLSERCLGKMVRLTEVSTEKYGRLLANIHLDSDPTSLNKWMVDQRFAVSYGGGTKQRPACWRRFHESGQMD
jgi:endonuclease YncB( thermonuclease family)